MPGETDETLKRSQRLFWETVETVIVAVILAFLIRTFVVESFVVDGHSMEPTLHNGEHLLVNKFIYRFEKPKDGQIIVFRPPLPGAEQDFIKRIIGTPGQTVALRDGHLYIDGRHVPEPFLKYRDHANYGPIQVSPGTLFVLGDNRPNSEDSRIFGLVPETNVRGEAFLIFWPPADFGSPYR